MSKNKNNVKAEFRLWIVLFFTSVVIGVVLSIVLERLGTPVAVDNDESSSVAGELNTGGEVNIREMTRALFKEVSFRILQIFVLLSAARFIIFLVSVIKNKNQMSSKDHPEIPPSAT